MKLVVGRTAPPLDLARATGPEQPGGSRFDLTDPTALSGARALVSFHRYAT